MGNQTFSDVKYRSPVVRFGGKFLLTPFIVSKMPKHTVYVELFAGAAHVLFRKPESRVEVINDLDGQLINFFRVLKNSQTRQRLIEKLDSMPYSRSQWEGLRLKQKAGDTPKRSSQKRNAIEERLKQDPELSDRQLARELGISDKTVGSVRKELERTAEIPQLNKTIGADGKARSRQRSESKSSVSRAAEWFYLNRSCFGGDMLNGGFAQPSVTGRNTAMTFRNAIDSLNATSERLRNVTIECLDYADCIKRYDSPESLLYVDSPYYNCEDYYDSSFTEQDHYQLSNLLHSVKARVMVSHYQNDTYDKLYSGWQRYEYQSFKGSHKAGIDEEKPKTVEVLYTNFEPEVKTRNLFQEMN